MFMYVHMILTWLWYTKVPIILTIIMLFEYHLTMTLVIQTDKDYGRYPSVDGIMGDVDWQDWGVPDSASRLK